MLSLFKRPPEWPSNLSKEDLEILKAYEERTTPVGWFVFGVTVLIAVYVIGSGVY